jgi:hypothetical protein
MEDDDESGTQPTSVIAVWFGFLLFGFGIAPTMYRAGSGQ